MGKSINGGFSIAIVDYETVKSKKTRPIVAYHFPAIHAKNPHVYAQNLMSLTTFLLQWPGNLLDPLVQNLYFWLGKYVFLQ